MSKITLQNGQITVVVDAALGAEITHISGADGNNLLYYGDWRSPVPVSQSQSYGNQVLDWLSEYRGGWQELFPNAGGAGAVLGTPLPFHGEVSRTRWQVEWVEAGRDVVLSAAARLPLVLERRMRIDPERPLLFIEETIRSEADFPVPYIWGHHPAWGPPLTETGARIDLPAANVTVDSTLDGPAVDLQPGSAHRWGAVTNRHNQPVDLSVIPPAPLQRLCYLHDLQAGWYAVRNPARGVGLGLAWDLATFPNLWLWQEIGGGQGMPWYGRAAITALEPAAQYPSHGLAAAIEAGQARQLQPGATATTTLVCALFAATDVPVTGVTLDGQIIY
jgi:hypothetical protein